MHPVISYPLQAIKVTYNILSVTYVLWYMHANKHAAWNSFNIELNKSQNSTHNTHSTQKTNPLKYNKEKPHSPQYRLQKQQRLACGNR